MIGVDRLDYSKGLPERIDGIGRFFDQHPERTRDLVFIQIAPPSREDVESYQKIRTELEQKTGQINGARSEVDLVPIRYVNATDGKEARADPIVALYEQGRVHHVARPSSSPAI